MTSASASVARAPSRRSGDGDGSSALALAGMERLPLPVRSVRSSFAHRPRLGPGPPGVASLGRGRSSRLVERPSLALAFAVVDGSIRCSECPREVDEFTAINEQWRYVSDGKNLLAYCPQCHEREFEQVRRSRCLSFIPAPRPTAHS